MSTFLAYLTVYGLPILGFGLIIYFWFKLYPWLKHVESNDPEDVYYDQPSTLQNMTLATHIDEKEWDAAEIDCRKIVDAGTRVWRIYRSVDRIHWAECDPALTERAACNYADYIKRNNPEEFVRCNDPSGAIIFYE